MKEGDQDGDTERFEGSARVGRRDGIGIGCV
jgi:hypothetical protein